MSFYQKFVKWLTEKPPTTPNHVVKIVIEFDTGLVRTLEGDAAKAWVDDLFYVVGHSRADWKRHNWKNEMKA